MKTKQITGVLATFEDDPETGSIVYIGFTQKQALDDLVKSMDMSKSIVEEAYSFSQIPVVIKVK